MSEKLVLYDALLREGPQTQGINLSVKDKLRLAEALDSLGLHYIEGGWPGANPKDDAFFKEAKKLRLKNAKLSVFGMTRRAHRKASQDPVLVNLVKAGVSTVTIFGKSWDFHVEQALKISLQENLDLIEDSVKFLKSRVDEMFYDAEHFFDGYKANPEYALKCLEAALAGGADCLVLCDTNGGSLPEDVDAVVTRVRQRFPGAALGIHCHNDGDLAVANSHAAVAAGVTQIQGCVNGYGERTGNTNLTSIIPNLALKYGASFVKPIHLERLTEVSRKVDEICNLHPRDNAPYVGKSAFAHKAGVHIAAVNKAAKTYEHINPERVGNARNILMSDQAGLAVVLHKAQGKNLKLNKDKSEAREVIDKVKRMESEGYQFEGAEASFDLLLKKALGQHRSFFDLVGFRVIVENRNEGSLVSEATLKVKVNGVLENTVGEGDGPINALDQALRKALTKFYPKLKDVRLTDFKVRVLDAKDGTAAKVRVLIESQDGKDSWGTVGVSENIIEASWEALVDSIDYKLLKDSGPQQAKKRRP
ncbi:MAG TPA: citramalate synthase [bacterium]|nr:citramalate synthase [bacterium]